MNISQRGIDFIKKWEGFSPVAIRLSGEKYYTIGYGHYGSDVKAGQVISHEGAENLLKTDLEKFCMWVNDSCSRLSRFKPNQNQFDALVSFTYNCGLENLLLLVTNRTSTEVAEHITAYTKSSNPAFTQGLLNRRKEEKAMFLDNIIGTGDNPGNSYKNAVEWAKQNKIFVGDGKGNYGWQEPVTREQLCLILYKLFNK